MVDYSIILDLLSKTNISKAAGIDKLLGTFIKDRAESIVSKQESTGPGAL